MLRTSKLNKLMTLLKIDDSYITTRGLYDFREEDLDSDSDVENLNDFKVELSIREGKNEKRRKDFEPIITPIISWEEATNEPPHPNLLKTPFSLIMVGTKGKGKSTVSINIKEMYAGYFDKEYMISSTYQIDDNWRKAVAEERIEPYEKECLLKRYNENKINKIWKKIKRVNKKHKTYEDKIKVHFCFNDIISELPRTRGTVFKKLARNHRHYGASATIDTQEFLGLEPAIRKNACGYILFYSGNDKERRAIVEELGGIIGMNRFLRMWNYCCSKPYGFLFINTQNEKVDGEPKYFFKFEKQLNPDDFSNERIRDLRMELKQLREINEPEEQEMDNSSHLVIKEKDIDILNNPNMVDEETEDIDREIIIEEDSEEEPMSSQKNDNDFDENPSSFIQSVLFDKEQFTIKQARVWLKKQKLKPIKRVKKKDGFLIYIIEETTDNLEFKTIELIEGIKAILAIDRADIQKHPSKID